MLLPGIAWVTGLFDNPATLPTHSPAANVEHLHGGFQFVIGERHHIGVGAVAEHHGLLFQRALQRGDVIPQPRRPLEVQFRGSLIHLLLHVAGQPVGLAREEITEVIDDLPVLFSADSFDAGRRAFVDIAQ